MENQIKAHLFPDEEHYSLQKSNRLIQDGKEISKENMICCLGCGVVMGNIDIPINHLMEDNTDEMFRKSQPQGRSYKCRVCDKTLPDSHGMTEHIVQHLKINEEPCEECHDNTRQSSKDAQRQLLLDVLHSSLSTENNLVAKHHRTFDLRVRPDITFPELVAVDKVEDDIPEEEAKEIYACRVCNSGIPTKESTSFHILDHIEANNVFTEEYNRRKKKEAPPKPKPKSKKKFVVGRSYVKRLKSVPEVVAELTAEEPTEEEIESLISEEGTKKIEKEKRVEKMEEKEKEEEDEEREEEAKKIKIPKIPIRMPYGMGYCQNCRKVHKMVDIIYEGTKERDVKSIVYAYDDHQARKAVSVQQQRTSDQDAITKKLLALVKETLSHDEEFQNKMTMCFRDWESKSPLARPSVKEAFESVVGLFNMRDDINRPNILFSELVAVENVDTPVEYRMICRICHQEVPQLGSVSHHVLKHLEGNELFEKCPKEQSKRERNEEEKFLSADEYAEMARGTERSVQSL